MEQADAFMLACWMPAQHFCARRCGCGIPVAQDMTGLGRTQAVVIRPMGMAMHQAVCLGLCQPLRSPSVINICIEGVRVFLEQFRLHPKLPCNALALWQRFGQECRLPSFLTHHESKFLVTGVCQTTCIAVRKQNFLSCKVQERGVLQVLNLAFIEEWCAYQKIAVASHEGHVFCGCARLQDRSALLKKNVMGYGVIAHPHFKQIAQNKDRICGRVLHVGLPHFKCGHLLFLQMQVWNEINRAPIFRGL